MICNNHFITRAAHCLRENILFRMVSFWVWFQHCAGVGKLIELRINVVLAQKGFIRYIHKLKSSHIKICTSKNTKQIAKSIDFIYLCDFLFVCIYAHAYICICVYVYTHNITFLKLHLTAFSWMTQRYNFRFVFKAFIWSHL